MSEKKQDPAPLVDLSSAIQHPFGRLAFQSVQRPIEALTGIRYLNRKYEGARRAGAEPNFYSRAMQEMGISFEVSDADIAKIPTSGPLMAVANHPYGAIDGIVFGALLLSVRNDAKLLANYLLSRMEEIRPWLIAVDPFDRPDSARANLRSIKEAIRYLREGHCLGTFPSGTVPHLHVKSRQITDPTWSANTAKLIHASKCTVLPIYFEGQNSAVFQAAGLLHPRLRTVLLPREMQRMEGATLKLRIGHPIPYRKMADFSSPQALADYLRLNTYILQRRDDGEKRRRISVPKIPKKRAPQMEPIAGPILPETLRREVDSLCPDSELLVQHADFRVFIGKAERIPHVLLEIGRLREKTFRDVAEGTGRERDLDEFDQHYRHLFMWDDSRNAIVGAYRVGLTDEILREHGKRGLYTSTLFKYKTAFLEKLGPALEVGRSFVISEYQRKHASLLLIWRGIGAFIVRHPEYKTLFGPVSINREYHKISRDLMVKFLRKNQFDDTLSPFVKAKRPPRNTRKIRGAEKHALLHSVRDIEDVSALISEIEKDRKGVPVLLKHYIKLKGRFISFNIDPDFGSCLDGLIMVDLTNSDEKLLRSYLTPEGLEFFLQYHRRKKGPSRMAEPVSL